MTTAEPTRRLRPAHRWRGQIDKYDGVYKRPLDGYETTPQDAARRLASRYDRSVSA